MVRVRSPASPSGSRVALLVAVLLLTLGLIAALAFEAYRADRSHRQVTEQVLQDYVRFAARELARHSSRELDARAASLLDVLACGSPQLSAARALALLDERLSSDGGCGLCAAAAPDAYVRFDPGRAAIVDEAGDLDETALAEIERALATVPRGRLGGFIAIAGTGRPALLVWRSFGAAAGVPVHAIAVSETEIAAVVDQILDERPLLPKALVEPRAQRAYLTAELRLADGTPLHRSGGRPTSSSVSDVAGPRPSFSDVAGPSTSFSAEEPLEPSTGGELRVVVALAAGAANDLIIGGLPHSRLPWLAALLFIAVGLIAVAVHQLRREHELARLRDAFVSGVSHELRTPLAQIRLFAETLRLGRVRSGEEARRSLVILDEEAGRLSHLVDNLLAFNRAGRVSTRVALEPMALAPLVAETIERFSPLVRGRRNRFEVDVPPGVSVQADRDAMARVLTNLLDNAVKYGSEGQTVRITATEGDGRARLIIDDEGSGIERAERRRIWEPFVRGKRPGDSAAATGTGIGLSVVRDLVVAMGGSAWADDAPSGGARFVIELRTATRPGARGAPVEPWRAPA